nr:hypothetical protein DM860_013564 [Ipomoea batatas]
MRRAGMACASKYASQEKHHTDKSLHPIQIQAQKKHIQSEEDRNTKGNLRNGKQPDSDPSSISGSSSSWMTGIEDDDEAISSAFFFAGRSELRPPFIPVPAASHSTYLDRIVCSVVEASTRKREQWDTLTSGTLTPRPTGLARAHAESVVTLMELSESMGLCAADSASEATQRKSDSSSTAKESRYRCNQEQE